jgi:NADPH2:quinone reductase
MVSGSTVVSTMEAMAILGRLVNIGRLGGMKAEFDFNLHARKRIDYIGVTFRTRTIEEIREIVAKVRADLGDAISAGKLRLPIDATFPLGEAPAAHQRMAANAHFGKILLIP